MDGGQEASCRWGLALIVTPFSRPRAQRLFDAVYDEGFTYIVHVDIKSDRALIDGIASYVEQHQGAHLIPSVR